MSSDPVFNVGDVVRCIDPSSETVEGRKYTVTWFGRNCESQNGNGKNYNGVHLKGVVRKALLYGVPLSANRFELVVPGYVPMPDTRSYLESLPEIES